MKLPRVLLINPPLINGMAFTRESRCQEREELLATVKPPLTIAYLSAMLKDVAEIMVVEATINRWKTSDVINYLDKKSFKPELIFFPTTTPTVEADVASMTVLKKKYHSLIFGFGPHTSGVPKETLHRLPGLDGAIIGEPEETVIDIVNKYAKLPKKFDKRKLLKGITGLVYRYNNYIYANAKRQLKLNIDSFPFPDWKVLPWKKYKLPLWEKNYFLVETSRGCPFGCEFCVVSYSTHGFKFRQKKVDKILDEIEYMQKEFGVNTFNLWADTFTFSPTFVKEFCRRVKERKLKFSWFANSRLDTIRNYKEAKELKKSGCMMLSFGIENPDDEILKEMDKKNQIMKTEQVLSWVQKAGIKTFGFFIYGYPGDNPEKMAKTTKFSLTLPLDFSSFYPAVPLPGTPFYKKCKKRKIIKDDNWVKMEYSWYVLADGNLNQENVMRERSKAYYSFYLRPKIISGIIKDIRSPLTLAKVVYRGLSLFWWVK